MSMPDSHILVVDDDEMIIQMMGIMLRRLNYRSTLKTNPIEALKWLKLPGNQPDLIISDVMMPEMSGYDFVKKVRSDAVLQHLPIMLLTANEEMEDKVAGFEAGTDDYLVKPVNPTELELRIKALLARTRIARPATSATEATVISVFSLRGGAGTTTVSVNVSAALTALWGGKVALVDLALKNGHCAMMFNLKPKYTMLHLAQWQDEELEDETVEQLLLAHKSGVRLLPAPRSPADAELITLPVIDKVWPYLHSSYPFIVVDAGSNLIEPALTILERSHHIVLLLTPELASLKTAVDALFLFKQLGFDVNRVLPVLNWTFPNHGLPRKNIEAALKQKIEAEIPYDHTAFVKGINSGRPPVLSEPAAQSSMAMATLAYQMSAPQMGAKNQNHDSQYLNWVKKMVG